ncbi:MAG: hypothetical protein AABY53_07870 [Bdellovibrionota bacterium]
MLKQYLLTPTCLKCGSFFCNDTLFCKICFETEIQQRLNSNTPSHLIDFQHHYLLCWNKDESDALSQMIYRLKSNNSKQAWVFYAKIFFNRICAVKKFDFKKYQSLIPIPGSKQSSTHSRLFANELSSLTGLPVYDLLAKEAHSLEQKSLSAEQRKLRTTFRLKNPQIEHFTNCIFVDDVVTTGESFLQCNGAIGGSAQNPIFSLFYRPKH